MNFVKDVLVPKAQHMAQENGLRLGQVITHPSEPITCELQIIHDDGTVIIGWAPKGIKHRVPTSECFNPNDCFR